MNLLVEKGVRSKGVLWISFGWSAFIAENIGLSNYRAEIINAFGNDVYHNTYNILSTCACGSILYGFIKHGRGKGPFLVRRSPFTLSLGFVCTALGFVGFSQALPKFQIPVTLAGDLPNAKVGGSSNTVEVSSVSQKTNVVVRCPIDFRPKDRPLDGVAGIDRLVVFSLLPA